MSEKKFFLIIFYLRYGLGQIWVCRLRSCQHSLSQMKPSIIYSWFLWCCRVTICSPCFKTFSVFWLCISLNEKKNLNDWRSVNSLILCTPLLLWCKRLCDQTRATSIRERNNNSIYLMLSLRQQAILCEIKVKQRQNSLTPLQSPQFCFKEYLIRIHGIGPFWFLSIACIRHCDFAWYSFHVHWILSTHSCFRFVFYWNIHYLYRWTYTGNSFS